MCKLNIVEFICQTVLFSTSVFNQYNVNWEAGVGLKGENTLLLEGNPERSPIFLWSVCPNEDNLLLVQKGVGKCEDYNYLTPLGKSMSSLYPNIKL